ncbi:FAD:protein FMN transferase [Pseudoxanthomonas dokdonensis]|uniref:FAD:protein FMN transferase n=1 Tax=Pseudoxanthomonas dokdonensis TaxID=344882 RepID=UPI001FE15496|nr:FAD:protein FMN transferase [Pseudoxanthomonas dokdonensis]
MSTTHLHSLLGQTMGTTWSVRLRLPGEHDLHALHDGVQARLDSIVAQMSTWWSSSDISRYNHAPAGSWHRLPEDFGNVLHCALDIARRSGGTFDPTVGPLVAAWGFGADAGPRAVPAPEPLAQARARVGWQRIQTTIEPLLLLQPGDLHLDFSAIAKGYAVDCVLAHLRDQQVPAALVEIGGELAGYGRKADGQCWQVLVEASPDDADNDDDPLLLALDGVAVATSGLHWHQFEQQGQSFSHTIDPRSGRPVLDAPAAVTVICQQAMQADAWATALTVMGMQAGLAFAQSQGLAARFVASDAGTPAMATTAFNAFVS